MKSSIKKTITPLLLITLLLTVLYGVVTKLVARNTELVAIELTHRYELQTNRLAAIADATKQNNADQSVSQVVKDCIPSKRKEFDTLLDKLSSSITDPELTQLTLLFYQCGDFYAEQRSLMTLVLNREVIALADTVSLTNLLTKASSTRDSDVKTWQDIAASESKIATFFTQLVGLQESIITSLRDGKTASSPEVIEALAEVAKVRGQMLVLSKQVEDYKATLLSI